MGIKKGSGSASRRLSNGWNLGIGREGLKMSHSRCILFLDHLISRVRPFVAKDARSAEGIPPEEGDKEEGRL